MKPVLNLVRAIPRAAPSLLAAPRRNLAVGTMNYYMHKPQTPTEPIEEMLYVKGKAFRLVEEDELKLLVEFAGVPEGAILYKKDGTRRFLGFPE